ncbi:MAG TPA: hypothetical protein VJV03_10535 [Pyrinomonadaceae bacterium]|nr:hypothetical protein [Pyrinomonadaceae bacterium]
MIEDSDLPELDIYRRFERRFPFTVDLSYGPYVSPARNENAPVHRWFRYKESFSANLLKIVIEKLAPDLGTKLRLLDPFCGVGTSLVSAQQLGAHGYEIAATGIERNPFSVFAANTKINWSSIEGDRLSEVGAVVLDATPLHESRLPELSSVRTGRCITRSMARKIVDLRDALLRLDDETLRRTLLLGLAGAVEPVSKVRKDGRALRIVEKSHAPLARILRQRWGDMGYDAALLQELLPTPVSPSVIAGDGRTPSTALPNRYEPFDLILTSPPYPNNIDYSEVYKLELWLLGFISKQTDFLELRKSTFQSHPTADFSKMSKEFNKELWRGRLQTVLGKLVRRVRQSDEKWRARLIQGYFSDLWISLHEHYKTLRSGGYEVLIVGNSLHGKSGNAYLIPTDICAARIAECAGFTVESIIAARSYKRRIQGNHFLRESIVVLKKK